MPYPTHLEKLIHTFQRLPGVGRKSAERFAFHLLTWDEAHRGEMAQVVTEIKDKLSHCTSCGCLVGEEECVYCKRSTSTLCVVASPRDVFSIEEAGEFRGSYHVLGGTLSPLEGRGPEQLTIDQLIHRVSNGKIEEIIIALDSTLEGDATALFLQNALASHPVTLSRLAFGIPMGSSLDFVDGGTLARAFSGRSVIRELHLS